MSRNTLNKLFIFAAGAALGSIVTWKLVKTKYEQIAQEEIESVREVYAASKDNDVAETIDEKESEESDEDEEDLADYQSVINDLGYNGNNEEKEEDDVTEPYVIPPGEYDENGYKTVSLYYYEDGVLENAITREVIKNPSKLVGDDFAEHFGEYEEDSVYVRNDNIKTDFEILKDGGYYNEN